MAENKQSLCPYVVKELSDEENDLIKKNFCYYLNEFVRVGERGYVLPSLFQQQAAVIRDMPLRSSDIFIVGIPRSGTTLTQELVWLVANDLAFETAKSVHHDVRVPVIDAQFLQNESMKKHILNSRSNPDVIQFLERREKTIELLAEAPSPRISKTHIPISLLPPGTLDVSKVLYVARDPRDVIVSCYHLFSNSDLIESHCEFKEFFDMFIRDLFLWTPYFSHVKEAWALRNHPNMLFLFYEELSKDINATVRRVAKFLGKQYSDEQFKELSEYLSFANFQKMEATNTQFKREHLKLKQGNLIRKGKAGGWRDYFDEDMETRADQWMAANMLDMDLRYPEHPK